MSNDGPTDIQSGINNSTIYRDLSLDCSTTEKLSKLTITRNNSPLKSFGEKKTRERNMKIARGHQMFKNIESALSDGSAKRKSLEQGKKEKQSINELQLGEMMLRKINVLMSNYVLLGKKIGQGLPELVAHLLIANWPREHARCDLESNDILFCIVSSIKGWLETIIGEVYFENFSFHLIYTNEIEEIESNCACALYEVCRFAQRKLWMKWPELVDECYAAVRDGITLNITLTKEARKALLDTMIMMHEWTSRHAKTLVNVSTQTYRTRV
uniref:Bm1748 n=1 Tax=Brugia malayi TaxID=6279 RepID=A0A0J9Y0N6_BRUMA|nr:Bm1748 [Brugia malayi]